MTIFPNRTAAGKELGAILHRLRAPRPFVLALPRGGVPVAVEVAKALNAPVDLLLVRKLGAPGNPELAIGAIADGPTPERVLNGRIIQALGVDPAYVEHETTRQMAELERRRRVFVGDRRHPDLADRTVIVVDDGIATGATAEAALTSVRRRNPRQVVLAVPVAHEDTIERLRRLADEVVCLSMTTEFSALSLHYDDFRQLNDQDVIGLLKQAQRSPATPERHPAPPPQ